jgi:hypothetical protein
LYDSGFWLHGRLSKQLDADAAKGHA